MGAAPSTRAKYSEAGKDFQAAGERRRALAQSAVLYCRENLFTMAPMKLENLPGGFLVMKADEALAAELGQTLAIGNVGSPYLVTFDSRAGNIIVQLHPDRQSARRPASPIKAPRSPSRQGLRSFANSSSQPLDSSPLGSPAPLLPQHTRVIRWRTAYASGALAAGVVPDAPGTPVLADRTAGHITVTWAPPSNDFGLIEKYEVSFRAALPLPPELPANSRDAAQRRALREAKEEELVRWNPALYGWRTLRVLHWYEWQYDAAAGGESSNGGQAWGMLARLDGLAPASGFEFRVRAASHRGFGPVSASSGVLESSPTAPCAPEAPFASHAAGDALWLHWPAARPNGRPVEAYELQWAPVGRAGGGSAGGGESRLVDSIELRSNSHFLRRLSPRTTYMVRRDACACFCERPHSMHEIVSRIALWITYDRGSLSPLPAS